MPSFSNCTKGVTVKRSCTSYKNANGSKLVSKYRKNNNCEESKIMSQDENILKEHITKFDAILSDLLQDINLSEDKPSSLPTSRTNTIDYQDIKPEESIETESLNSDKEILNIPPDNDVLSFDSVPNWLKTINKENLSQDFIFSGFDDLRYIRDVIEQEDLNSIGVSSSDYEIILSHINKLSTPPPMEITSSDEFTAKYLTKICDLDVYCDTFIEQGYVSFESLSNLNYLSLLVVLNIHLTGHRKRLIYYINKATQKFPYKKKSSKTSETYEITEKPEKIIRFIQSTSGDENLTKNSREVSGISYPPERCDNIMAQISNQSPYPFNHLSSIDSGSCPIPIEGEIERQKNERKKETSNSSQVTLFMSTTPPHPSKTETKSSITSKLGKFLNKIKKSEAKLPKSAKKELDKKERLVSRESLVSNSKTMSPSTGKLFQTLRAPKSQRVLSTIDQGTSSQDLGKIWIHDSSQLINDHISIDVSYLGMYPVKNITLKNKKMVQESIQTLKTKSANQLKIPQVSLLISAFDIRLNDTNTKNLICSHKMSSILFCSQDSFDQRVFCYVYHEENSKEFLCNVFRSTSVKLCNETILAIGYSFELNERINI